MENEHIIYLCLAILFIAVFVLAIFVFMLWFRTDTIENKVDEVKLDLKRNYEFDDHQETQINLMKDG